jgi:MFS family permease
MIVAPMAGMFASRIGQRKLIVAGQLFLAAGLFWTALSLSATLSYPSLIGAFVLAGIGMGLTFAPVSTMVLATVKVTEQGVASGTNNTIREFGVAAGVAALSSIFSSLGGFSSHDAFIDGTRPAVLTGATIIAVGAVIALWLPRRA